MCWVKRLTKTELTLTRQSPMQCTINSTLEYSLNPTNKRYCNIQMLRPSLFSTYYGFNFLPHYTNTHYGYYSYLYVDFMELPVGLLVAMYIKSLNCS